MPACWVEQEQPGGKQAEQGAATASLSDRSAANGQEAETKEKWPCCLPSVTRLESSAVAELRIQTGGLGEAACELINIMGANTFCETISRPAVYFMSCKTLPVNTLGATVCSIYYGL